MLSLFRSGVVGASLLASAAAGAAEYYFEPLTEISAEHHTNRDLEFDSGVPENVTGYIARLNELIGIITPTSETEFRPQLNLQRYPSRDDLAKAEEYLTMKTRIESQRTEFDMFAKLSRQDAYTAELVNPQFDELNPGAPTTAQSGRIVIGNRRTNATFEPRYTYDLTPRTGIGLDVTYSKVDFQSELAGSQVDFNYELAKAFIVNKLTQNTDIESGVYVSKFKTDDDTYQDNASGISFILNHTWTQRLSGSLTVQGQRDDLTETPLVADAVSSLHSGTNFGAFLALLYKGETSRLRLTAGRQLIPSSAGTVAGNDVFRVQYDRNLSARLTATGALVANRQRAITNIGALDATNDHDYDSALVSAKWAFTPTWYVQGEFDYTRSKYVTDPGPAHDEEVVITFGYRGLGPQQQ